MKNIFSILEQTPKKDESEVITAQGNAFLTAGTAIKFDCWYDWVYDCRYRIADSFFWSPISKTKFFHSFLERTIKNKCYKKHKNYVFQKAKEGLIMKNIFNKTKKEIIKFVNGNFINFKVKKEKDKILYNIHINNDLNKDIIYNQCIYYYEEENRQKIFVKKEKDKILYNNFNNQSLNKDILCIYGYEEEIRQKITKKFPKIKFFFIVGKEDKIAVIGRNELAVTMLFQILMGLEEPDSGSVKWGASISPAYFPKDHNDYFENFDQDLIEWMRQFSEDKRESYLRTFLGRMLFSGDDVYKPARVLSGGEKVRCMLSRMMLSGANFLVLDQPTNHLDLESIAALNNGLEAFKYNVIFSCHDHQLTQTVANRIIEITDDGIIDRLCTYDEYMDLVHI